MNYHKICRTLYKKDISISKKWENKKKSFCGNNGKITSLLRKSGQLGKKIETTTYHGEDAILIALSDNSFD